MQAEPVVVAGLIEVCRATIAANSEHLCELDRAIGDGDHGTNMKRGCDAVSAEGEALTALPFPEAVEKIGLTLVMNVGGAAGPLYGTLLMEIGRELRRLERLQDEGDADFRTGLRNIPGRSGDFPIVLKEAIDAVARRGRANAGDKTLLDVLYPVQAALSEQQTLGDIARRAEVSASLTAPMRARRGRASYLGDRSIGHVDPGASSCALLTKAICSYFEEYRPA
ncbi:dihydroxyacetone kinase subunit DhaL [Rhizobium sp. RAF56]|uniref:dihydroxyacetone kinase subunit DhaL n=1 Tax=Rhizobium sp. RAF56 TaxID=3233062 RepID=UPI003F996BA0